MTSHADLLPTYRRLREDAAQLSSKLARTVSRQVLDEGGSELGILQGRTVVLDWDETSPIWMDYCIYNVLVDGQNAVQRSRGESPPPADSQEMTLLKAMLRAYYSMFRVV